MSVKEVESLEKRVYELEDRVEELGRLVDLLVDCVLGSGDHDHMVEMLEEKLGQRLYRREHAKGAGR